jgi:hypothetical protein
MGIQVATPKWINDIILMDYLITGARDNFTYPEICMINRCRIYLKAEILADITMLNGTRIQMQAYKCTKFGQLRPATLWPKQIRPGTKHIKAWQKFINMFLKTDSIILKQSLGPWTQPLPLQRWYAYKHCTDNTAIAFINNQWQQFTLLPITRFGYPIDTTIPYDRIWFVHHHETHKIADVFRNVSDRYYIQCYHDIYQPPNTVPTSP